MNETNTAIGILGAGLSGICMGIQLKRLGIDDFVIYEKGSDVGGTWLRNTFPGLHCDVPSHLYCYSFEPNAHWTMAHASQPEILNYIRDCAKKYGLLPHIRFDADINDANFDEDSGTWTLKAADGKKIIHRVLVSATGGLTEPNIPKVSGLNDFAGPKWHAGAWRDDVDLSGLRVAVIGSAASAVQVVPEVADRAGEVFVFQRSPSWVMPRNNVPFSAEQQKAFEERDNWKKHWRKLYRKSFAMQRTFNRMPAAIEGMRSFGLAHMKSAIDDPEVIANLTPDYDPGCKRIVVSDEYYPAFAKPHVHLKPHALAGFTSDAVIAADGSHTSVDVVIFCTGYRLGSRADGRPAVNVYGRDGLYLPEALGRRPESYRGVAIPGFPNYFTICGINGVAAYTSLFASAEIGTEYIAERLQEFIQSDIKSIEVKSAETQAYNEAIQEKLQTMSWATGQCTNFYRDRSGRVLSFYPYTLGRMRRELRNAGSKDFMVEHF